MNELALFAGAGGGILGGNLLGWTTVAAVEIEPFAREILLQRQRDGFLDKFPIPDADLQRAGRRSACHGEAAKMGDPAGERLEKSNAERRNMPPSTRNPSFLDIARRGKSSHARSKTNAWWASEPGICRVVDGLADRMDRLKAIGNGQVPLVAATAFTMLKNRLEACDNA